MVFVKKYAKVLNKRNISILVFVLCCIFGVLICSKIKHAETEARIAHANQIANTYASSIEETIHHSLSSTNTLAVMVHQNKGTVANFSKLAKYMLPMYNGAYALSIAPDGIMQQIEPPLQNKGVENHDFFEGKDRVKEIQNIKEGDLQFLGPFKLIQGPQGVVGRLPVFLKKEDGTRYFWGYTVVTLQLPNAIEDVQLNNLVQNGYAYELSGINPFTKQKEVIDASKEPLTENVISVPIQLHGADWSLKVSSLHMPTSLLKIVSIFLVIILVAGLVTWLTYLVLTMSKQREQLNSIAMFDPLTNLPNRRLLNIKLEDFIRDKDASDYIVVCYLDLDGFKYVNDAFGHEIGDELLKVISKKLLETIKKHDFISRVGGDEFVIVLNQLQSLEQLDKILKRIVDVVREQVVISDNVINISVSLGAAIYKIHGDEPENLLRIADQTMYQAKKSGKNRFYIAQENA
ncbi:sensor domain-containing diguanylate cyclase [Acinetobacter faecalis]|uniref:sensor domain-containing diguanylate cyclase n=1 Tax=Acinetobacter faecalis TaxID=2665161 RepID=UPI002A90AEB5|nr:sensor domain-containing diguanylate cyclase [Acinetobacter faecalis]MDY6531316.1 sensor domain-containing diguanylate cyclase [Acinetobacter faecalis]